MFKVERKGVKETSESVRTHYHQQLQAIRLVVTLLINLSAVRPEPPLNLHLEMTGKGQLKICWSDPVLMPYPLQYEVKISASSGQNGWQVSQLCSLCFTMEQCTSMGPFQSPGFLTTLLLLGQWRWWAEQRGWSGGAGRGTLVSPELVCPVDPGKHQQSVVKLASWTVHLLHWESHYTLMKDTSPVRSYKKTSHLSFWMKC